MQIYIVKESLMNGTVTLTTKVSGIEAESYEEARDKLLRTIETMGLSIHRKVEDKNGLLYQMDSVDGFSLYCELGNEPLKIIKVPDEKG